MLTIFSKARSKIIEFTQEQEKKKALMITKSQNI